MYIHARRKRGYWFLLALILLLPLTSAEIIYPNDALDGEIRYLNGVYNSTNPSINISGLLGTGGNYYWYRGLIQFDLPAVSSVDSAFLNLFLYFTSVQGTQTGSWDLNSVYDLRPSLDESDWDSLVFEEVDANWFDETIDYNISYDITDAVNNALAADRNYIAFRWGLKNENTYTSTTDNIYVYFCDMNQTTIGHECLNPVTNPYLEYTESAPVTSSCQAFSLDSDWVVSDECNYKDTTINLGSGTLYISKDGLVGLDNSKILAKKIVLEPDSSPEPRIRYLNDGGVVLNDA